MDDNNIDFSSMHDGDYDEEVYRRIGVAAPSFGATTFEASSLDPEAQSTQANKILHQASPPEAFRNGVWSVTDDQISELPDLYQLDPSAVFVPDESPEQITARISGELRDRSIEAEFDHEHAKATCTTTEGVEFRIKLYRGRGKFSNGTIVEVQRRFGTAANFHADTSAILDRARGKQIAKATLRSAKDVLPLVADQEDDYQPDGSSSLKMVAKMLNQPGYDSHFLALQTLSSLTDVQKMGTTTVKSVAKELIKENNEVGNKILSMILNTKGEDETFKLRTLAMTILANTLQAVSKEEISDSLREQLQPVLLRELRSANKNQRNAVQAAKCVESLLTVEDSSFADYDEALKIAMEVGRSRHLALERQVEKCLKKILA
jgi:hypothetical protein